MVGVTLMALPSFAAVMMVDFGATTVTGADQLNSPYHTAYNTFNNATWNKVTTADLAANTMLWSDGSVASGVSLNLGRTGAATDTALNLSLAPVSAALGAAVNTGVYSGTSPGRDATYATAANNGTRHVGFQLGGLAAGVYEIYITGRNTSLNGASAPVFYFGTSASAGNFNFAGMHTESLSYLNPTTPSTAAWVEDVNYVRYTMHLAAGQYLNISTVGTTGDPRGFLNSFQIGQVVIPEPSSILLMFVGFVGLSRYRRNLKMRHQAVTTGFPG